MLNAEFQFDPQLHEHELPKDDPQLHEHELPKDDLG